MKHLIYMSALASFCLACQSPKELQESDSPKEISNDMAPPVFNAILETERSLENQISKVGPSLAYVEVTLKQGSLEKTKTKQQVFNGIVVDERGYLSTLAINEEQVQKISVWINEQEYEGEIIEVDHKNGFSLLKINSDEKLVPLAFGDTSKLRNGQTVYSVNSTGTDLDFEVSASIGNIHAVIFGKRDIMLTNNINLRHHPILPTYGMPIVNSNSEIIGISTDRVIVLSDSIQKAITEKIHSLDNGNGEKKDKENAWFGMTYNPVNRDQAEALSIPRNSLLITKVYYDSPSGVAGLQPYDLIIGANGVPFTRKGLGVLSQMNKASDISVGDTVVLNILRGETEIEAHLNITKKPPVEEITVEEFGVSFRSIRSIEYFNYGLPVKEGLMISRIESGSPAATSTYFGRPLLYTGDVISSINNVEIKTIEQLRSFLDEFRRENDKKALIRLYRSNYTCTVNLNTNIGQKSNGETK